MPHSFEARSAHGRRPCQLDPLLGTWLDERFLVEQRIATGGFGAIYRGRTRGGAPVALKILHPSLTGDPDMVARFRREGATLTRLSDPHTVATLAVGETATGTPYIAMELLSGESLHDRVLRERVLPWQAAVSIARSVCSSLAEAHAIGVVHRDLKPANIHVETRDGRDLVKVLDFGVAKLVRGSAADDGRELTRAGHMIGTYDYMSPEQIVAGACDAASDIYSLGVVMYEMLTGQRPFAQAASPAARMTALLTQAPPAPSVLAAIPPALDRIVMRCLEREPRHRFAGVVELAAALDRVLEHRPTALEEITAVHPALGATLVDERLWSPPPTGPAPWAAPRAVRASASAPAPRAADRPELAADSGPRNRRSAPAVTSQTLPGVAVAALRHSRPNLGATPVPTTAPALPVGFRATLHPQPPAAPVVPPARSFRALWIALALIGIAAITAATAVSITLAT